MDGENGSVVDDIAAEEAQRDRLLKFKERRDAMKAAGRTKKTAPRQEGETAMGRPKGSKNQKTRDDVTQSVEPVRKRRGRKPREGQGGGDLVTIEAVHEAFDRAMELMNVYRKQKAERLARLAAEAAA
jgi:hypothetical protein